MKNVTKKYVCRPTPSDAWRFANWDIIPAIGIMAFGKLSVYIY